MSVTVTPNASVPTKVIIRNVRIGYANGLNEARVNAKAQAGAKPQFSSVFFVPETETAAIQAIQAAMWAAVTAKFGDKANIKWTQIHANNKIPFKNGALNADKDGYLGNMFLQANARENQPPKLLDIFEDAPGSGRPAVLNRPQNRIYSGCYVNLEVNFWAYDKGADGVACDMLLVQFAADGERFGGGVTADESAFGAAAAPTAAIGVAPAAPAFAAPAAPAFAAPAAPQFAAPAPTPAFAVPQMAAPQFAAPAAPAFPGAPF
jgi:hypothetical protein